MKTRTIGDVTVSAIGLGGMPLSIEGRPDESQAIATIHAALDAGITLIDTADAYRLAGEDNSHNERVIAEALRSYGGDTSGVLVANIGHAHPKVKQAIVGYGAAQKIAVAKMVQRMLNLAELPAPDAADALALALTHAHENSHSSLNPRKKI